MFDERAVPEDRDAQLSALFAAYRAACPDPEASANFMPRLWAQIEARQSFAYSFKRLAQAIITAAAAVTILMGLAMVRPETPSPFYTNTYLELLAADQGSLADAEIIHASQEQPR